MSREAAPGEFTRLSVNLNDECAFALRSFAARHDVSMTEAVRRAIAVLDFVDQSTRAGKRIRLIDEANDIETEVILL